MSNKGIKVTVEDLDNGDIESTTVLPGDYVIITVEPATSSIQAYANGTHVITVKRPGHA